MLIYKTVVYVVDL